MIEAVKSDISDDIEWKEFLRNQYNIFYDYSFIKYNDVFEKNINWYHLKIRDTESNKVLSIINGCVISEGEDKVFLSCNGVSLGGFLWKKRTGVIDYIKVIKAFNTHLKENGFKKALLRTVPFLYNISPDQEGDYALLQCGYKNIKSSITNIIDLREFEFRKISDTKKRAIKKTNTLVEISILEGPVEKQNFFDFYKVLEEDRALKGVKPTHSIEELMWLKNNMPENIILFSAKIGGEIAAICVLFVINENIILNFYLASEEVYQKDTVSEYILYKSIEWSKENNYTYYDIGTSDINNVLSEGLFAFKKRFLANGFLRKTFEINL
ncbi:hypothetical protein BH10BAC5_BH10BAC5_02920 [soil metagenome]